MMLYRPPPQQVNDITGDYLAHNHLPARQKALLAGELIVGKARLVNPTTTQAALLARVSVPYAAAGKAIIFSQPHLRSSVASGQTPLLEAARAGRPIPSDAVLDKLIARAGAERVWAALSRLIDQQAAE